MKFSNWLEQTSLESEKQKQLKDAWEAAFKALEISGPAKADMVRKSLKDITAGDQRKSSASTVVSNRLSSVFQKLKSFQDAEIDRRVQDTISWLGQEDSSGNTTAQAPSKSVEGLMRRLFGDENFDMFVNETPRSSDIAKSPDAIQASSEPQEEQPQQTAPMAQVDPNAQMPNQQPQIDSGVNPFMKPTNPMPQKPAGAGLGMF